MLVLCVKRQVNLTWTKRDMPSGGVAVGGRGLISQLHEPYQHPALARKACKTNTIAQYICVHVCPFSHLID